VLLDTVVLGECCPPSDTHVKDGIHNRTMSDVHAQCGFHVKLEYRAAVSRKDIWIDGGHSQQ